MSALGGIYFMAQKVTGFIKLQIPAGKATPAPPVGPALGQHGVNIMAFTKEFNERTKNDMGMMLIVLSHSSQKHHQQLFLSRKLAVLKAAAAFLTRQRLPQLQKNRFRRLLNRKCLT